MTPTDPDDHPPSRGRGVYLAYLAAVIFLGLASRRFGDHLPSFIAAYAGDTLWATAVYLGLRLLLSRVGVMWVGVATLSIAFAVETSQLYHAPWIDSVRRTTLGALLLGRGFLWSDLVCYTAGAVLGMGLDAATGRMSNKKPPNASAVPRSRAAGAARQQGQPAEKEAGAGRFRDE